LKPETLSLKVATNDEAEDIKQMALAFFEASPYSKYGVDAEKVGVIIQEFLNSDPLEKMLIALMDGDKAVGVLATIAAENIFNRQKLCCELIWWIDPEYRNYGSARKMVQAYEYWAKHKVKAQIIQLISLDDKDKLYTHLGFTKIEQAYTKEI
jgi:Acetyltransferases, including N-acetylases of ribosomal proteins